MLLGNSNNFKKTKIQFLQQDNFNVENLKDNACILLLESTCSNC